MSLSKAQTGSRRVSFQGILCGVGVHAYEAVGSKIEEGHRYSETHETLYDVRQHRTLLRCSHCGREAMKVEKTEQIPVGQYVRVFRKGEPGNL